MVEETGDSNHRVSKWSYFGRGPVQHCKLIAVKLARITFVERKDMTCINAIIILFVSSKFDAKTELSFADLPRYHTTFGLTYYLKGEEDHAGVVIVRSQESTYWCRCKMWARFCIFR